MNSTLPTEKNTLKVSEYAAFISYQHMPQDRQWAEWLVEALETYRTLNICRTWATRNVLVRYFAMMMNCHSAAI